MAAQRLLALPGIILLLTVAVFGQKAPQPAVKDSTPSATAGAPTVDQIIDHYMAAVGGRAAWQKLTSRSSMGTIEVPSMNLSGTVVIHEKAPDKILTIVIISGSAFRQGFDGSVGWADDPQGGFREQTGAELAEAKRQSDFYSPFDLHEHYAKLTFLGSEKVDDRESYVLEATPAEGGQPDKLYFDAQSGLPVRLVGRHHTPEGVSEFREEFSDYRNVDGVRLPFTISQESSGSSFTVTINEVRHNIEFEDSEFSKPAVQ
jgi:outer membrane lipoprotein-sorting protein